MTAGPGREAHPLPTLSVIVPMYQAESTIGSLLDSLAAQRYAADWELIVVDNGSTDDGAAVVRGYLVGMPQLRLLDVPVNRGPGGARNVGAYSAVGDMLVFVDSDDVVDADWLTALGEAGRCGSLLASREVEVTPGMEPDRSDRPNAVPPVAFGFLPWASGTGVAIATPLFREIGGWDEARRIGEDIDFCWRAQLKGARLELVPTAVVLKRSREGLRDHVRQRFIWGAEAPRLLREYRRYGARPDSTTKMLMAWLWIITRSPYLLVSPGRRRQWLGVVAGRLGRLRGSVRWRTWCP